MGFVTPDNMRRRPRASKSEYGQYLLRLVDEA